jgi:hypothetical protein
MGLQFQAERDGRAGRWSRLLWSTLLFWQAFASLTELLDQYPAFSIREMSQDCQREVQRPIIEPIMRNMKALLHLAASVFLVCAGFGSESCASAQQSPTAGIVGRWRSVETSKGGIGVIFEFHSDGTVDFSPGAIVEMQWRIENDQLILPSATEGGPEQKQTLKWLGDNKLSLGSGADVVELTRAGERTNAEIPILGEWIGSREMDGHKLEFRWLFSSGGKGLFLMPFVTQHGSYTISGSALHLEVPQVNSEFRLEVTDSLLTLSKPDGSHADRYARY